ncbi:MAG: hypothetical protein ACRECH_16780, partial [Nitrososphaerales archaeon]
DTPWYPRYGSELRFSNPSTTSSNGRKHTMTAQKQAESVSRAYPQPQDDQLSINLRHSCVDCAFVISCPIAQQRGAPDTDVLVGSYRISALKERCLL